MGSGPYPAVALKEARDCADIHRREVRDRIDPISTRETLRMRERLESARLATFSDCAKAYIESHRAGWKNKKHAAQWSATLESYAHPVLGNLPVSVIDTSS
jgi:hypothetical protein